MEGNVKPAGPGGENLQAYGKDGRYESKVSRTDSELEEMILKVPKIAKAWGSMSPDDKAKYLSMFRKMADKRKTEAKMAEDFSSISTRSEYLAWASHEEAELRQRLGTEKAESLLSAFHSDYKGQGQRAFNLLHCVRSGYERALEEYCQGQGISKVEALSEPWRKWPTEEDVADWSERISELARSSSAPRDMKIHRYVDENALYALTKGFGIWEGSDIVKGEFGLDEIDKGSIDVDGMLSKASGLVGMKLDGDGAISSFSANATHMGNHVGSKEKRVKFEVDVPKGTPLFPCNYGRETEILMPPRVGYYVKSVEARDEETEYGSTVRRLVIRMGIREEFTDGR